MKENFSTIVTTHNTRGNKGKECALQRLDSIAYACRGEDYDANLSELRNYNEVLAKWVGKIHLSIGKCPNFPKKKEKKKDKMTKNLVESFNAWLKNECHHSICTFFMDHMIKLGSMLVKRNTTKKTSI